LDLILIFSRAKPEWEEEVERARKGQITIRELRRVKKGNGTKEVDPDVALSSKIKSLVKFTVSNDPYFADADKDTEIDKDEVEEKAEELGQRTKDTYMEFVEDKFGAAPEEDQEE